MTECCRENCLGLVLVLWFLQSLAYLVRVCAAHMCMGVYGSPLSCALICDVSIRVLCYLSACSCVLLLCVMTLFLLPSCLLMVSGLTCAMCCHVSSDSHLSSFSLSSLSRLSVVSLLSVGSLAAMVLALFHPTFRQHPLKVIESWCLGMSDMLGLFVVVSEPWRIVHCPLSGVCDVNFRHSVASFLVLAPIIVKLC